MELGFVLDDSTFAIDEPDIQARRIMREKGINPPSIYFDGKIHRFPTSDKKNDDAGWYILFNDGIPCGLFGDWRTGFEYKWVGDVGRELSLEEISLYERRMLEARQKRDAIKKEKNEKAANDAEYIYGIASDQCDNHPYLQLKKINKHNARVLDDGRIVVPLYDVTGTISSLQYITDDGEKKFLPGGAVKGCFNIIGNVKDITQSGKLYVCEGFATAATIADVTGKPVSMSFSAGNIPETVKAMRSLFPAREIIIVADNDENGVGISYANKAATEYGAKVVFPLEVGQDANDYVNSGKDLLQLLEPKVKWLINAEEFCAKPEPVSWLVKKWLQEKSLMMIHGPSGSGKTFIVIDWACRLASGGGEWMGNRVKDSPVVYLAGEGHVGLKARISAWKQFYGHGKKIANLWVSSSGCDIDEAGPLLATIDHIRSLPVAPSLIIIDTLHRFMRGDENSSQDAGLMIKSCARLQQEFNCSVLLVHHTGVSEEAQHRARGSSAWRAALDIEISVIPPRSGDDQIEIVQRKAKDAEMPDSVFVELQQVALEGWLDEDSEQITSAVIVRGMDGEDGPKKSKRQKDGEQKAARFFETVWEANGKELDHLKRPTVSASAMRRYLMDHENMTEKGAAKKTSASEKSSFVSALLSAGMIENVGTDRSRVWSVKDVSWMDIIFLADSS